MWSSANLDLIWCGDSETDIICQEAVSVFEGVLAFPVVKAMLLYLLLNSFNDCRIGMQLQKSACMSVVTGNRAYTAHATAEISDAAGAEAYHSLQTRQQALQSSTAEQLVQSTACQHHLEQQVQSLQSELTAAQRERHAAMAGMKALQTCDETNKCNLHIGLSQVQ